VALPSKCNGLQRQKNASCWRWRLNAAPWLNHPALCRVLSSRWKTTIWTSQNECSKVVAVNWLILHRARFNSAHGNAKLQG
jgi:hypothetical protein